MSGGVGPRVPKDDFMRALGLESSDARHEGLYKLMRVRIEFLKCYVWYLGGADNSLRMKPSVHTLN